MQTPGEFDENMSASIDIARASTSRAGRVITFGDGDALLGTITVAQNTQSRIGAILWGFGIAETKTARRLAKLGIPSMQVRISGPDFNDADRRNALLDSFGVSYCRMAMDKLAAECQVSRFILMGNCACANVCFNAAVADPRVTSLILTNPHISKAQVLSVAMWRKLSRQETWKRALTGKMQWRSGLRRLSTILAGKYRGEQGKAAARALLQTYTYKQDVVLPADFDEKLKHIADRGVSTLIVASKAEDDFYYIKKTYRGTLDQLLRAGALRIEELEGDTHVFSTNDKAAGALNDAISRWIDKSFSCTTAP